MRKKGFILGSDCDSLAAVDIPLVLIVTASNFDFFRESLTDSSTDGYRREPPRAVGFSSSGWTPKIILSDFATREAGTNAQRPRDRNSKSFERPANMSERDMLMMDCSKDPGLHDLDRETGGRDCDDDDNRSDDEYPNMPSVETRRGTMSRVETRQGLEEEREEDRRSIALSRRAA
jgi:hypothetical protein